MDRKRLYLRSCLVLFEVLGFLFGFVLFFGGLFWFGFLHFVQILHR